MDGKDLVVWGAINGEQPKAEATEAPAKWGGGVHHFDSIMNKMILA